MAKILNMPFDNDIYVSQKEFEELQEIIEVRKADKIYKEIKQGKRKLLSLEEFKKRLDSDLDV